jgi:hypothetical protein
MLCEIGYAYIFTGVSVYLYINICVYTVIIKKKFGSENGTRFTHEKSSALKTELVLRMLELGLVTWKRNSFTAQQHSW